MSTVYLKAGLTNSDRYVMIRTAKSKDAIRLLPFLREAVKEEPHTLVKPGILKMSLEEEVKWIVGNEQHFTEMLLIAEYEDQIIGMLDCLEEQIGISVAKQFRGDGVGHLLLVTFIDWANWNMAARKISAKVERENVPAIRFFKHHGFIEEGVPDNTNAITMIRDLNIQEKPRVSVGAD